MTPSIRIAHDKKVVKKMPITSILLLILILMLVGAWPIWPHSKNWGYYPSGSTGLLLTIIIVLMVTGRI